MTQEVLCLTRSDVRALLTMERCIAAVEAAFGALGRGELPVGPGVLGAHLHGGGFHIKTAAMGTSPCYFAAKVNGNFPENPARHGLPTIQGVLALFDGALGTPLAVMDSMEITVLRTAAASAVAAKYLALPDAKTLTLVGCGVQGRAHLRALRQVRPIERVYALDTDPAAASALAREMGDELAIEVLLDMPLERAIAESDICATTTTARRPILFPEMLHPGLFIAAVGADNPHKQELDPELMRRATVVTDVTAQAAEIGDLHHALAARVMTARDVHAELAEVVSGRKPGRTEPSECIVFDSTGTAVQDVAAASIVYEAARTSGHGTRIALNS